MNCYCDAAKLLTHVPGDHVCTQRCDVENCDWCVTGKVNQCERPSA
jgi:hypothetical protein